MSVESTKLINNLAFEITSHEFKINFDVPEKLGGNNTAPTPHDYYEAALAECTSITVMMYAKRKQIPLENIDVKIKIISEGAKNEISREIKFIGNLSEEQIASLTMIADKCPIHKLISAGAHITTQIL